MNTEQEPEFLHIEHDAVDPQTNLLDYFEQIKPVRLWGSQEDLCQMCFQQPGYHFADVDRLLFVCDDCYNSRNISIDPPIPPVAH